MRARVLFVDDQKSARDLFPRLLDSDRYEVFVAGSVVEAEEQLRAVRPDAVVTDLRMPDIDGLDGLERFHRIDPELPVVLITAFGTVETAVEAMKRGAFDYIRKPFEPSEIEIVVERAMQHRRLVRENARLRSEVARKFSRDNVICRSRAMQDVMSLVDRVAPTDFAVLVQGESGTGKDVVAKLIHYASKRADAPFVSLNCSAIPEHLLESELFGYEKGAFSGAVASRAGFFAKANGGTLFLDEIGDMSLSLQPKLLRVLQDGEYYPVGSRSPARTDARLICATNQDLPALVEAKTFREDLYYRINTVRMMLPPLRERTEEIPYLVEHFLVRVQGAIADAPKTVGAEAMRALLEYRWPGNIRELEHAIELATLVANGPEIQRRDLPPEIRVAGGDHGGAAAASPRATGEAAGAEPLSFRDAKAQFERDFFVQLLDETGGNVQRAAELAGIHRTTLYEKLGKLGIEVER
jgi:two-component system response regulator HydG